MATTFTWIAPGSGNWNNTANWSNSTVPNSLTDSAWVINGGTATVDPGIEITIGTVTIGATSGPGTASAVGIANNAVLEVAGAIINATTLSLNGSANTTELRVAGGATVTLSGGGTVTLGGTGSNLIRDAEAATGKLINVDNTIQGAGNIGGGQLALDNQAAGIIDANSAAGLTLSPNSVGYTNEGLIEATNGDTLNLNGSSLTQNGGTLLANGANSVVELYNGVTVTGGTLTAAGGGAIITLDGQIATLGNVKISAGGTYTGKNNSATYLYGTIDNAGTMALDSTGNTTEFRVEGGQTLTLTGGGTVDLEGDPDNFIRDANQATGGLINVDNTILGVGNIGNGQMALDNQAGGVIDANGAAGLTLQSNAAGFTNEGLVEATDGGLMTLQGGTLTQTGGSLVADGTGSVIQINNNATVIGGSLATTNGGSMYTEANTTVTLSNLTVKAGSTYTGQNNSTTYLNGTIDNAGTMALDATVNTTEFLLEGGQTLTLTGGGTVNLEGAPYNVIRDANLATGELINVDNTIQGVGDIGYGQMALDNQASGVIDANAAAGLILQSNAAGFTNEGLIEATGGGVLTLQGGSLTQTGGSLVADGTGSVVRLNNGATLTGGSLASSNGGSIETQANTTVTLSNATIEPGSTYVAQNNSTTFLSGILDNQGTIAVEAGVNTTELRVFDGATLTGGGIIAMDDNANNVIFGNTNSGAETLTNVNNTIEGSGTIGYSNGLEFLNDKDGVIDATGTAAALVIQPTANGPLVAANGGGFVNLGLLESTNTGGLVLSGSQFNNLTGTILASGAGDNVYLRNNVTISGGSLNATDGGEVQTVTGNQAFLDGTSQGTLTMAGTLVTANNSTTYLSGMIVNTGQIELAGTANSSWLRVADGTTLTGGGTIAMTDSAVNAIFGAINNGAETFTNVNNTIEGSGTIGYSNGLEFINDKNGVIDATGTAAPLVIQPASNGTLVTANGGGFVNLGLLEATNTGGLVLAGSQINNAGGTILASGSGNDVYLENNITISGGSLGSTGGGEVLTPNAQQAFLDGGSQGALTLTGTYVTTNNSNSFLDGTINNTGQFQVDGSGNSTELRIADGTTLTGGGTITLSDSSTNLVFGATNTGAETVTNVNNTIQGSGTIGYSNGLEFINDKDGIIDATGTIAALVLQAATDGAVTTKNGGGFVNLGLLEATNTAGLVLARGQFNNAGGTILGAGKGNNVYLTNNATVSGGVLKGTGGANIQTVSGTAAELDGASQGAITLGGTYVATDNSTTYLTGTIKNTGQFDLNGASNTTELRIFDGTTLAGGGTLTLSGSSNNLVFGLGNSGIEVLTNLDNTVQGSGTFGYSNSIGIVNGGTFTSTGTAALVLNPSTSGSLPADLVNQSSGLLQGTGTGGLTISEGSVNNQGTIQALDDSSVTFSVNVTNQNAGKGTLTAGIWAAYVTTAGDTATLDATGGTIDTDSAEIVLSGSGASVAFYNGGSFVPIQNSLTSITSTGQLNVLAGANYTAATATQAIANAGLVTLGGGTFTDATFTNSGTFSGFGDETNTGGALANSGHVVATGGDLVLAQGVTGFTGGVTIGAGASLDVSGAIGGNTAGTLLHDGNNLALGAQNFTVGADYDNANFGVGNSFDKRAGVTGTGLILAAGTVTQVVTGNVQSGTSSAPVMAFGNIHVGDTASLSYAIGNLGSGGPVLRGAIQTAAGGGSLTDARLTGAGVTAGDFGPIAQGTSTSALAVTFSGLSAGSLVAQTVHIANNFDNVAEQNLTFTGAAYRLAAPSAAAPNPIAFGNRHFGDVVSQGLTLTNIDPNDNFSEALDASIGGATGGITASGSFTGLTAQQTNKGSLNVVLNTGTVGAQSGQAVISLISDGDNIDGLGTTALAGQTVTATGTIYRYAAPSAAAPNPIAFGNRHFGDVVSQGLTMTNTAANDGFSEALDAAIGGAAGGISASGSFTALGAQTTNQNSLVVSLNTGTTGVQSGQAVISLVSDGNGIDGLGTTALAGQTVTATGTIYAYAAPIVSPATLDFGATRTGQAALTQTTTIANGNSPDIYQEALGYSAGTPPAGFSVTSNGSGILPSGFSATMGLSLGTGTSGDFTGSIVMGLTSEAGGDGLGNTVLTADTIAVSGTVFAPAVAQLDSTTLNFGVVHVGDQNLRQALTITNAASGALTDDLTGGFGTISDPFNGSGSLGALAANASGTLTVGLDTKNAGSFTGSASLALVSHDADLADVAVAAGPVTVTAIIDNYATAAIVQGSGPGSLSQSGLNYFLNFGTVQQNSTDPIDDVGVLNAAIGPADLLNGIFAGATGSGFLNQFGTVSGLAAGQSDDDALSISLDTSVLGQFTETVTLMATGTNSSNFSATLTPEVLTITGVVACFASGTRLATEHGEVAVEALTIGDRLQTASGASEEIVWIGQREVDCRRHPRPETVWPVRVAREAFGPNVPHRDLFLSPDHAVMVNGVLVPVKLLINGTSIAQVKRDNVIYFHVELPEHDVILAEGLPAESYLDTGDRADFGAPIRLYTGSAPDIATAWETRGGAPLVMAGMALAAARAAVVGSTPGR